MLSCTEALLTVTVTKGMLDGPFCLSVSSAVDVTGKRKTCLL